MTKRVHRLILPVLIWLLLIVPAHAGKRVALVVGNSAYEHAAELPNPRNDASDIAAKLEELGFEVHRGLDLERTKFEEAVRGFLKSLKDAEAAVFYYAGHGFQLGGENYLIPVDAKLESDVDVEYETITLGTAVAAMERQAKVTVVFLDACRDNPLSANLAAKMGDRSAALARGFTRVNSAVGTLIVFSTQPGNVAVDGEGRNSPFTAALIKHIGTPGVDAAQMTVAVRREVLQATDQKQVPWTHSSLTSQFFFNPGEAVKPGATAEMDARAAEIDFWERVRTSGKKDQIKAYMDRYPGGMFIELAKFRLGLIEREAEAAPPQDKEEKRAGDAIAGVPVTECDRLAAIPFDDNGVMPGIGLADLDQERAIPACRKAVAHYPEVDRFKAQLAYGLVKGARYKEWLEIVRGLHEKGYPAAAWEIGKAYENGVAVESADWSKAVEFYAMAANRGYPAAARRIGELYREGGYGLRKDLQQARKWEQKNVELLRPLAERGVRLAMNNLGYAYVNGKGVPKNLHKAAEWFSKAAETGSPDGYNNLGFLYENGLGVQRDFAKARELYEKGVGLGSTRAADNLGIMYFKGRGVRADPIKAAEYLQRGAELGNPSAMSNLAFAIETGRFRGLGPVEAAYWYLKLFEGTGKLPGNEIKSATRREVQKFLKADGYYKGPIDGQFGPDFKVAAEAYLDSVRGN